VEKTVDATTIPEVLPALDVLQVAEPKEAN